MQHLNYCRQFLSHMSAPLFPEGNHPHIVGHEGGKFVFGNMVDDYSSLICHSPKFILPPGGILLEDRGLKAISDLPEINLPYASIVLEYDDSEKDWLYPKKIILAWHHVYDDPRFDDQYESIFAAIIGYNSDEKKWALFPVAIVDLTSFVSVVDGAAKIKFRHREVVEELLYERAMWVLFHFLNALACRNVHIEKSPAKATKQGKKVKTALPFDDYHFLTVDVPGKAGVRSGGLGGSHRSPREHLRRGHIRRLDSGPIWVNACVVNAGIGSKVGKSYLVRKSA